MTTKKCLIIGFGPGWTDYPQDYEGEVWGLNTASLLCPRLDRLFLADRIEDKTVIRQGFYEPAFGSDKNKKVSIDVEGFKQNIRDRNIPFVSCHPYPDVPTCEVYPLKEIVEAFGSDYFSNCIAYMIAYAIWKGFKEIELIGIRQGLLTEYAFHKGSVEFWIGMAVGHGINVKITGDSHLLRTPDWRLYGYKKTLEELKNNNYKVN